MQSPVIICQLTAFSMSNAKTNEIPMTNMNCITDPMAPLMEVSVISDVYDGAAKANPPAPKEWSSLMILLIPMLDCTYLLPLALFRRRTMLENPCQPILEWSSTPIQWQRVGWVRSLSISSPPIPRGLQSKGHPSSIRCWQCCQSSHQRPLRTRLEGHICILYRLYSWGSLGLLGYNLLCEGKLGTSIPKRFRVQKLQL